jgi:hypothetical protein
VATISGLVRDASGAGVNGLTIRLGGGLNRSVKTNGGSYAFYNLPKGLDYTVTPDASAGFGFSPSQQTVTALNGDAFLPQFTAGVAQPYAQFSAASYRVAEDAGSAQITVTRSGNISAAGEIDYATLTSLGTGTASDRSDYTPAFGTLRFAPGEASKSFTVFVTNDGLVKGDRTLLLQIRNGSGVLVTNGSTTATLTITEDDTAASSANPLDTPAFFVRQHYVDFLNREPDAPGLTFWTNQTTNCGNADLLVCRINVSAAFFLSIEFQETGYLVYKTYGAAFGLTRIAGTVPLTSQEFLPDEQEVSRGVVIGEPGAEAKLEANKVAYFDRFVLRPLFLNAYPQTMTPAQFVDALNASAGNPLSQAERDALVAALASGAKTRAQVLRAVAEDADFNRAQLNKAFVLMEYFGYLRRSPDDPPDADFAGYNFWLGKLNQFGGNYITAEMVKGFITSGEYRERFR